MLGIYVAGLVPALLLGGPFSDAAGRKRVALGAIALSRRGQRRDAFWHPQPGPAVRRAPAGRHCHGHGDGRHHQLDQGTLAGPLGGTPPRSGRGRGGPRCSPQAAFGWAPLAAGLLANSAPAPETLPYLLHIALCIPMALIALRLPETRARGERVGLRARLVAPSGGHPRFRRVIAPAAPWAFGSGTIGFAVVPALLTNLGDNRLLYTTAAAALTLGAGVLIQPLARRVDDPGSARAILTALAPPSRAWCWRCWPGRASILRSGCSPDGAGRGVRLMLRVGPAGNPGKRLRRPARRAWRPDRVLLHADLRRFPGPDRDRVLRAVVPDAVPGRRRAAAVPGLRGQRRPEFAQAPSGGGPVPPESCLRKRSTTAVAGSARNRPPPSFAPG